MRVLLFVKFWTIKIKKRGDKMNFGRNLAIAMLDRGITKTELAQKVGCSVSMISKICKRQRMPSLEIALKIGDSMGISVDRLMKGDMEYAKRKRRV